MVSKPSCDCLVLFVTATVIVIRWPTPILAEVGVARTE